MSARAMLDTICDAVLAGLEGGEIKVDVVLRREIVREGDVADVEYVAVRGFKCAGADKCGRPHHVFVEAIAGRYEYPDHLVRRDQEPT